jgi:hypothetical protein
MNKDALKEELATRLGINETQAGNFLDTLAAIACEQMATTGTFSIPSIVTLNVKRTKGRSDAIHLYSPVIKRDMVIPPVPPKNRVRAKVASIIRESVQ